MEEKTKKEIAKRFIDFCERFMKLYKKNYEYSICNYEDIACILRMAFITNNNIYKFWYDDDDKIICLAIYKPKSKFEEIKDHKIFDYYYEKKFEKHSNYIAGQKTWEEKYQEIINE